MIADRKLLTPLLATAMLVWGGGRESVFAEVGEIPALGAGVGNPVAGPPPSTAKLQGLTELLESEDYRTRMGAQSELLGLAKAHSETVAEALVGPYLTATDADLRARLRLTLWNAKQAEINERPIGFVGIQMQDSFRQLGNQPRNGLQPSVLIMSVIPNTAAKRNDLRVGDLIVAVDGKGFEGGSPSMLFKEIISARTVGEPVELKILRGAQELTVKLALGERPMDLLGFGGDERDRLEMAFGAFLRESAEKRGLPVPDSEAPENARGSQDEGGFGVDPFGP